MAITITLFPSISSHPEGISAKFNGERVSYNGDYLSSDPYTLTIEPGWGVIQWHEENSFNLHGEIRVGTEVIMPNGRTGIVSEVLIRVINCEAGWDTRGVSAREPRVKTSNGQIDNAAWAIIPMAVHQEIERLRREA